MRFDESDFNHLDRKIFNTKKFWRAQECLRNTRLGHMGHMGHIGHMTHMTHMNHMTHMTLKRINGYKWIFWPQETWNSPTSKLHISSWHLGFLLLPGRKEQLLAGMSLGNVPRPGQETHQPLDQERENMGKLLQFSLPGVENPRKKVCFSLPGVENRFKKSG